MKLNRFYPKNAILSLLTLSFVATTSVQAQFDQRTSTAPFEAIMYPMNGPSPAIKVNFNNLSGGAVRVVIRNQQGKALYDEYEPTARYRRRFDLSSAPAGELSKHNKQQTQTFVIEAPVERHIAMKGDLTQPIDKNLAAKQ